MSLDTNTPPSVEQEAAAASTDAGAAHENVDGVTEIESLCMNCHDDVCAVASNLSFYS